MPSKCVTYITYRNHFLNALVFKKHVMPFLLLGIPNQVLGITKHMTNKFYILEWRVKILFVFNKPCECTTTFINFFHLTCVFGFNSSTL